MGERLAKGDKFARGGKGKGDARGETLEVEYAGEVVANFFAENGVGAQLGDGVEAGFDFSAVERRTKDPGAEETRAHAGGGFVESGEEGGGGAAGGFVGEKRSDQLEIADGNGVEGGRNL